MAIKKEFSMCSGKEAATIFVSQLFKQEFGSANSFLRKKVSDVKYLTLYEKKKFIVDFSSELSCVLELGMQRRIILSLVSVLID